MHRTDTPTEIFLQPGEYFVGQGAFQVRTLLGSCVSITLWHPGRRIGAMSHFLLGQRKGVARSSSPKDGRYGDDALRLMLAELEGAGVLSTQCQAKIFGGGDMFPRFTRDNAVLVGQQNGAAARQMLQERQIPILSEHLYGVGHRQIVFDIGSGDVWVRQIAQADIAAASGGPRQLHD